MWRLPVLMAVGSLACSADPVDLSERLATGQARAGVVQKAADLIGGPTAEGRVGDFKLYNSRVAVIIQQPGKSDGYGTLGGFIVDADVVRPAGQAGQSLYGEAIELFNRRQMKGLKGSVVNDGQDRQPAIVRMEATDDTFPLIEAVIGQARGPMNLAITIDYVLAPDANFVRVETHVKNPGTEDINVGDHLVGYVMGDGLSQFLPGVGFKLPDVPPSAPYFGAASPDVSYSFVFLGSQFAPVITFQGFLLGTLDMFHLGPGVEDTVESVLVIGDGDLAAHVPVHEQVLVEAGRDPTALAKISGSVKDAAGKGVARAYVHVLTDGDLYAARARTKADGSFEAWVAPGAYKLLANVEAGDLGAAVKVTAAEAGTTGVALTLPATGLVEIAATENGAPVPVRIEAHRQEAPAAAPDSFGLQRRVHGAQRLEFLAPKTSTLALPPGHYTLKAARGFEYETESVELDVKAGETARFAPVMRHVVETPGWLSGDYHIHAQKSADSDDLEEHKVLSFVAEHLEVPVSTEHEHIGDYAPVIARLGLSKWVRGIVGEEVSTTNLGHFNAFPLQQDLLVQNNGAIGWYGVKGDDLMKLMRANPARPLVQVNHPRSGSFGSPFIKGYFSAVGFDPATFTVRGPRDWSLDWDAMEVANGGGPSFADWFAFLDRGRRILGTGDSDSHEARSEPAGYPRNYVQVGVDTPEGLDVGAYMTALRAGKLAVSGGYFVESAVGTKVQGELLPTSALVAGELPLDVRVQAPSWVPAGRLEVVVNGAVVKTLEVPASPVIRLATRVSVPVPADVDSYVLVRVQGVSDLPFPYPGASSWGFTNPFFVDANSNAAFDGRLPMP